MSEFIGERVPIKNNPTNKKKMEMGKTGKSELQGSNVVNVSRPSQLAPLLRMLMKQSGTSLQDRLILVRAPWITDKKKKKTDMLHASI